MTSSAAARVVVELTPPGRAAVAVVAVAGPNAVRAVDHCFVARSGRSVSDTPLGRIVYGRWGGPEGEEIVVCRRDAEHVEVHCHGGTAAVAAVIDRLVCLGCHRIGWQEWHASRSPDPLRAAAQIALAAAVTERTAAILLDQMNGALSGAVREIAAHVAADEWSAAASAIDELLSKQELGLHLIRPWRVVVVGAPNVGKSSLINALAGYDRAIVSPTPGTTRDVVTVKTAIDGWPVELSDTAGFRETQDELESAGIELAKRALSGANLAIVVHDAAKRNDQINPAPSTSGPCHSERSEESSLPQQRSFGRLGSLRMTESASRQRAIHVVNKIDLISATERLQVIQRFANSRADVGEPNAVSALNGEGIADLISAIARALVPVSLPSGAAVPFTAEQVDRLTAIRSAIRSCDAATASGLLHAMLTGRCQVSGVGCQIPITDT